MDEKLTWVKAWTPELARMLTLVAFYRDQGCCAVCALGFAVAEVEREAGRKAEKPRSCEACRDIAVKCYQQRPKE